MENWEASTQSDANEGQEDEVFVGAKESKPSLNSDNQLPTIRKMLNWFSSNLYSMA